MSRSEKVAFCLAPLSRYSSYFWSHSLTILFSSSVVALIKFAKFSSSNDCANDTRKAKCREREIRFTYLVALSVCYIDTNVIQSSFFSSHMYLRICTIRASLYAANSTFILDLRRCNNGNSGSKQQTLYNIFISIRLSTHFPILLSGSQRFLCTNLFSSPEYPFFIRTSSTIFLILETSSSLPIAGGGCLYNRGGLVNLLNPKDDSKFLIGSLEYSGISFSSTDISISFSSSTDICSLVLLTVLGISLWDGVSHPVTDISFVLYSKLFECPVIPLSIIDKLSIDFSSSVSFFHHKILVHLYQTLHRPHIHSLWLNE